MKYFKLFFIFFFLFSLVACSNNNGTDVKHETVQKKKGVVEKVKKVEKPTPVKNIERYYIDSKLFTIHNVKTSNKKIILLTFDDGPRWIDTDKKILDILDKHHAKSIWFVNGIQLVTPDGNIDPAKRKMLLEIKKRGNIIGNHTFSHANLTTLSEKQIFDEVKKTSVLVKKITGEEPKYFRHPYGSYNNTSLKIVSSFGMQHLNWSVGSLDWETKDPNKVVAQVTNTIFNGAIILMHDNPHTAVALDPMLTKLEKMGYTFVLPTEIRLN
jgi:peptidoglycan/xylan/chitin deacetylase (PgdA/CDA1 family)